MPMRGFSRTTMRASRSHKGLPTKVSICTQDPKSLLRQFKQFSGQSVGTPQNEIFWVAICQADNVIGVYVAWRGIDITLPVAKFLTFWSRKATGETIAAQNGLSCDHQRTRIGGSGARQDKLSLRTPGPFFWRLDA
jgi:hypothetical protein